MSTLLSITKRIINAQSARRTGMTAAIEEIALMRETVAVSLSVFAGRIASDVK